MTQMSEAFDAAGYVPPQPREDMQVILVRLMGEAIVAGGGLIGPSTQRFIRALMEAEDSAALLWELFNEVSDRVIGELFARTLERVRAGRERDAVSNGAMKQVQQGHAISAPETAPDDAGEAVQRLPQGHSCNASPASPHRAGTGQLPRAVNGQIWLARSERDANRARAAATYRPARPPLAGLAMQSALRAERIWDEGDNPKPLAEATVAEVVGYVRRHAFKNDWLLRLTVNLPHNAVIGEWRTDEDLFAAQKEARIGMAAA